MDNEEQHWEKLQRDWEEFVRSQDFQPVPALHKRRAEESASDPDEVNAPAHYRHGDVECIDAIEAALTPEEFRGHCKANALKYVWRERHKGGDVSLRKAIWYLERALRSDLDT